MKLNIIILLLIPFLLFSEDKEISIGEIIVEDNYITKIETIHKIEEKDKKNKENLKEIVESIPSIHFNIGSRGEANFNLRGFTGREIPILIDGIPVYMPYSGSIDLFKIKSESIKEVKVSSGLSSVLYGPNSLGGAINIITKKPKKGFSASIWSESGISNNNSGGLSLSYNTGKYYISLMPQYQITDGYNMPLDKSDKKENNMLLEDGDIRENSDKSSFSNSLILGYNHSKDSDYRLSWFHINEERGMPIELNNSRARYWRFPEWRKDNISFISKNKFNNKNLKTRFFYDSYYNKLEAFRDDTFKQKRWDSIYDDYSYGSIINYSIKFLDTQRVEFLLNYKHDTHREGESSQKLSEYEVYNSDTYSLAMEYSAEFDNFSLLSGVSFDKNITNNKDGKLINISSLNPQAGLTYWLTDNTSLSFSLGKKSRFPTLKELFSGYIDRKLPNPDLISEDVIHSQLSFNFKHKKTDFTTSLFYSNVDNLIETVYLENEIEQLQNVGNARYYGIELSYKNQLFKTIELDLSYIYQQSYSKNLPENKVPFQPKNIFKLGLAYKTPFKSILYLNSSFISQQYELGRKNDILTVPSYIKIDFKITQKVPENIPVIGKKLELYLKVNNILDSYIYTQNNFPLAGREFFLGASFKY